MAKRFTDTNKFRSPFFRSLPAPYKLLWDLINHDCDHAGLWMVDFEIAQIYIGKDAKIDPAKAFSFFNSDDTRVIQLNDGKVWLILPFIFEQYGSLNSSNRVHQSVISTLQKFNIDLNQIETIKKEGATKPLTSPLQGVKDKDKVKDKDMDVTEQVEGGAGGSETSKLYSSLMAIYFDFVKQHTGVPPKVSQIEGKALKNIIKYLMSIKPDEREVEIGWKAIFENFNKWDAFHQKQLKLSQIDSNLLNIISSIKNGKQNSPNTRREITNEDLAAELRKRYPDSVR